MDDLAYLRRRAAQEKEAAMRAAHPKARQCHLELAERYERRSRMFMVEDLLLMAAS